MHESLDELKFRPDTTTNTRVICPCASEKLMYNVVSNNGKNDVATFSQLFLIKSFFILAGNNDIRKSLDEFEIRPDPIRDHRVSYS